MGVRWKWVVLWSLWAARLVRQPTAPVRIASGWLVGSVASSGQYNQYLGIPYATIPERFQAPGPAPVWENFFEAVNENCRCRQALYPRWRVTLGQDNCLCANVYTPMREIGSPLLPVMVFIHGGGFFEGSATPFLYGPEYLVNKGVILVTINYRLNKQGFLCLRIKEAPGNAGMKDQVAALKWVQRNIKAFGGDPNSVTIFGESAGGASVSYHLLSPMSKGLFHKAIIQSGSSTASWANQINPINVASLLTKVMGYETQDPQKLYDFLSEKSNDELIHARVPGSTGNLLISRLVFTPCAEDKIDGEEPFITEIPYDILSQGKFNKVPVIIGANEREGILFIGLENDTTLQQFAFAKALPKDLTFPNEEERLKVAEELERMYMGGDGVSIDKPDTLYKMSKFSGDMTFNYPGQEEARLLAQANDKPVYNYLFAYDNWRNIPKILSLRLAWMPGATHADELFYIFSQMAIPSMFENKMIERMTTMWTNFAKYGDPTPEVTDLLPVKWRPIDPKSPEALKIDAEFRTVPMWYDDALIYWRELYSKYRRKER